MAFTHCAEFVCLGVVQPYRKSCRSKQSRGHYARRCSPYLAEGALTQTFLCRSLSGAVVEAAR
jgi:hypothetical protein